MIIKLEMPARDAALDFRLALSRRNASNRSLLTAKEKDVLGAYALYETSRGDPSLISPLTVTPAEKDALQGNYELTYTAKALWELRTDIMALAPREVCPICGRGQVGSLDHHLPKSLFPEFAIFAPNLVPACTTCNEAKRSLVGNEVSGRFLHPFYDEIPENPTLLVSTISVDNILGSISVDFMVNPELPQEMLKHAKYHFQGLSLEKHYIQAAVVELLDRAETFAQLFDGGGAEAIHKQAGREAARMRKHWGPHYWKAALWSGVAAAHDFCAGGFSLLRVA